MDREKFMQEARRTAHQILVGKENGIMNLVQQAWAEGKRNAEVETLRTAIDEALDKRETKKVNENAVYPAWGDWLAEQDVVIKDKIGENKYKYNTLRKISTPIPASIAEKLGIEPKGES